MFFVIFSLSLTGIQETIIADCRKSEVWKVGQPYLYSVQSLKAHIWTAYTSQLCFLCESSHTLTQNRDAVSHYSNIVEVLSATTILVGLHNLKTYNNVVHLWTDNYPLIFFTDINSGPLHHQDPLIMLQNVRSDVRENNK